MNIERRPFHLPVPLSAAVSAGGFVFMSGVVALDAQGKIIQGDIREQTRNVLEQIQRTLQLYGLKANDVVRTSVWLADLAESAAFNEEYGEFFHEALPARSCVQAVLYGGARVEIEVQALAA
ncbi:RidA family protein [Collimonas fungivorans]|uniref:RidA family protein n=1 Tax=Collimonas fungivorans TaxID=158899 RepID=UPI0007787AAD|nr:Rid family hydrolase [Collimonas fungivorans]